MFFSLLPDDSKIIPFGSFTHLQTYTDHCRMIYRCIDVDVDDHIYILTWLFFHSLRMVVLLMLNGRSGVSGKFLPMASSKCGDFTMSIVHVATGGFT